mmetsp:Transcript_27059/g.59152  ORF Transcript_27059/g.59152 Transcript_27059/m.59152 type:complete len:197 (+) Transcript_27059:90-680(+)
MSYSSKSFQSTWSYDPKGDTHNDRIGRILAHGANLQQTLRNKALASTKSSIAFENEQKNGVGNTSTSGFPDQTARTEAPAPDGRGMVWVDSQGQVLGQVSSESYREPIKAVSPYAAMNERQTATATLNPTDRSMYLWRKVNPGCMKSTTRFPTTTMKEHFRHETDGSAPLDKTQHRKKTDFSEFVEAKVKFAQKVT